MFFNIFLCKFNAAKGVIKLAGQTELTIILSNAISEAFDETASSFKTAVSLNWTGLHCCCNI